MDPANRIETVRRISTFLNRCIGPASPGNIIG